MLRLPPDGSKTKAGRATLANRIGPDFSECMIAARILAALTGFALVTVPLAANPYKPLSSHTMPDTLVMLDGDQIRGLILKNTADSVLIQTEQAEMLVPKSQIRRISDEIDGEVVFADIAKPGRLPSWRAMVFDLRNHDSIYALEQIPATTIEEGFLKNIPYLSFRVNDQSEFNIYGDPQDPVAIEFGMYGARRKNPKYHRIVREFLAGHLQSREQIAALYSLPFSGGEKRVGPMAIKITPPHEADAYGGWWITVYNPSRLQASRLSDAAYAEVTRPFDEISRRDGRLRRENVDKDKDWLAAMVGRMTGTVPQVRGFYRDKDGVFRLLGFESTPATDTP
jgi:hypothetical protein